VSEEGSHLDGTSTGTGRPDIYPLAGPSACRRPLHAIKEFRLAPSTILLCRHRISFLIVARISPILSQAHRPSYIPLHSV
jgi:hypothetical protein